MKRVTIIALILLVGCSNGLIYKGAAPTSEAPKVDGNQFLALDDFKRALGTGVFTRLKADLVAFSDTRIQDGWVAKCDGGTSIGDGFEGLFEWDSSITAGEGGVEILATGIPGGWRRLGYEKRGYPEWWGATAEHATGGTDDTTALQNAIDFYSALNGGVDSRGGGDIYLSPGRYVVNELELKLGVHLIGPDNNPLFNKTDFGTGKAWGRAILECDETCDYVVGADSTAYSAGLSNLTIRGGDYATSTIKLFASTETAYSGISLNKLHVIGGITHSLYIENGTYEHKGVLVTDCHFEGSTPSGDDTDYGIYTTSDDTVFLRNKTTNVDNTYPYYNGRTKVITDSTDNLDIANWDVIFVDPDSGDVTIGGVSGESEIGKEVRIVKVSSGYDVILEHNEGVGDFNLSLAGQTDVTLDKLGGVSFVFNGYALKQSETYDYGMGYIDTNGNIHTTGTITGGLDVISVTGNDTFAVADLVGQVYIIGATVEIEVPDADSSTLGKHCGFEIPSSSHELTLSVPASSGTSFVSPGISPSVEQSVVNESAAAYERVDLYYIATDTIMVRSDGQMAVVP